MIVGSLNVTVLSIAALLIVLLSISTLTTKPLSSSVLGSVGGKPYPQTSTEQFNVLRFGGALAPYVSHHGYGVGPETPEDCVVDQVHLLMRHGERYPTYDSGKRFEKLLNKLQKLSNVETYTGPLAFIKDYKYFATDEDYELETHSGPYNGLEDSYKVGLKFREKYGHLFDDQNEVLPVFSAGQERVVDTAKSFAKGFLAKSANDSLLSLQALPESSAQGANTLTAATSCKPFDYSENDELLSKYSTKYLEKAANRLNRLSPGFNIDADDAFQMMSLCGFELNVRGDPVWCKLFTKDEWVAFGYQRDLDFYYRASYGHSLAVAIGSNYANATATLLKEGPSEVGKLFFSFSHDTDITPVVAAMGLLQSASHLSVDQIDFFSPFKCSQIVPMGAKVVVERLKCSTDGKAYARIILNDSVIPLANCSDGPGFSCEVNDYHERIIRGLKGTTYTEVCQIDEDLPQSLEVYWNWSK
ncbi:hypothetical protein PACTADRAFT_31291 [Pachysolen tannophilus NRRL Y-2460]|uniref:Uncharacterized protein n=1 Tax=Pachysolen tannophilus NRRL Y-2460 TaxID=669874 RepID=A0A1E4U1I3_PACTA|nr:hypothetical protein PACTADRAFT_31291 [Pachysolen tannophilus NRRL Y-2460]